MKTIGIPPQRTVYCSEGGFSKKSLGPRTFNNRREGNSRTYYCIILIQIMRASPNGIKRTRITRYGTSKVLFWLSCNKTKMRLRTFVSGGTLGSFRVSTARRSNRWKVYKRTTPAEQAASRITDASARTDRVSPSHSPTLPFLLSLRAHLI